MYNQLAAIEDKHWYFVGRRIVVTEILSAYIKTKKQRGIDLGCGTGGNLQLIEKFCQQATGLDYSPYAIKLAKLKGRKQQLIKGDLNNLSQVLKPNSFDLVTIFNVLYHIWVKNEAQVIKNIYQIIKPGGFFIVNEPAFPVLFRHHDLLDLTKKRYYLMELEIMLKKAGFKIINSSYFNTVAFFPALFLAVWEKLKKKYHKIKFNPQEMRQDLFLPPKIINNFLIKSLALEAKIIKNSKKIPFGVCLICLVQKPSIKQ